MTAPAWMTPEQAIAYEAGAERANAVAVLVQHPSRIDHDRIVSFAVPAFLTNDYDPTHRPGARR